MRARPRPGRRAPAPDRAASWVKGVEWEQPLSEQAAMWTHRIELDPNVMLGKPVVKGTRIPVELVLRKLGEGATMDDLRDAYPRLMPEDVYACLVYAADTVAHEEVLSNRAGVVSGQVSMLRFLADESCDYAVVRALTSLGHEVLPVAELSPRADDETVIGPCATGRTRASHRGQGFRSVGVCQRTSSVGVVLLRFPAGARSGIGETVADFVSRKGAELQGRFIVIQPGRIRMSARYGDWLLG